MQRNVRKYVWLFLLPTLIAFLISFLIPFLAGIYLSFTEFTTVTDATWAGLQNYVRAFTEDRDFLNAFWFTLKFTIVSVLSVNLLAFILAFLLT